MQILVVSSRHLHGTKIIGSQKASGENDDIDFPPLAIFSDNCIAIDLRDVLGHEFDVSLPKRSGPDTIVAEHPLRTRRVIWRHLFEEIRPIGKLHLEVFDAFQT